MSDPLTTLTTRWRSEAELLRKRGATEAATTLETCAAELEEALAARATEPLTLGEAASESGFSAGHLGRLVREGTIPNVGRKGAPRVRRGDLPRKPGRGRRRRSVRTLDLVDET